MNIAKAHQKATAKRTLRMTPAGARIMGGMTFEDAYRIVFRTPLRERLQELIATYGDNPKDLSWELETYGWPNPSELLRSL